MAVADVRDRVGKGPTFRLTPLRWKGMITTLPLSRRHFAMEDSHAISPTGAHRPTRRRRL